MRDWFIDELKYWNILPPKKVTWNYALLNMFFDSLVMDIESLNDLIVLSC